MAKRPVGRPTLYKPEYCQMLIDHMATGLSYECFGGIINVSKQTVYDWEKHPDFLDAKRKAFTKCRIFWEKLALNNMINTNGKALNSSVWIFNMKNRFDWTDKKEIKTEVTESKLVIDMGEDE